MKNWRKRWQRYRRQNRFLISLYLGVLLLAGGGFALYSRMRALPPEELTNRLLTFLLWWFDLTLIAILLFILLRNFVRLALERHRGILGSRFRTKLLLSFMVLILAPAALLFLIGVLLLSRAATFWFSAPVEGIARSGLELAEGVRLDHELRSRRAAVTVARAVEELSTDQARLATIERLHGLLGNDLTGWLRGGTVVVELVNPRQRLLVRLPPFELPPGGGGGVRGERFGGTVVARAWEPLSDGSVVVVALALPTALVEPQARLAAAGAAYERLKLDRPTITATVVLGFGGLALLVVFAAAWLGLYLARRFTEPLLALVATTERAAAGDTLEEVPLPAEDEVGLLVGSFNSMVRRLREQEDALRRTVRRLDAVLGAIRTGVLELDDARTTVRGNPAAAALLGLPELVEGAELARLHEAGLANLAGVIQGAGEPVRGSLTVYPGGVARSLEVAVVPLSHEGLGHGWVVTLEDLTPLQRAQRQAAWSEVARRIAHQIKNPLTPIRLAAERIARHVERNACDLRPVVAQGCQAIVEHVQAMQEMVDAFALYAKLPPLARRPVAIKELLETLTALYVGVKEGVGLRLDVEDLGEVLLDPEQFRQAVANVLDNAFEASPPGSEVVVKLFREGDAAVIEVADHGPGLGVEDPELLFQPFFSTKGRGSGVGLAVVQRIISDHGGTVRLQPNQPTGVRAVLRLPLLSG